MVNKLVSAAAFLISVFVGLVAGTVILLGILYSIPKVTEKLEYYD